MTPLDMPRSERNLIIGLTVLAIVASVCASLTAIATTTYRASLVMGTASTWANATTGLPDATRGLYWHTSDDLPYVHQSNGSEFPLSSSDQIGFSPVTYASTGQGSPIAANGNFTVGLQFALTSAATITGLRFYYPDGVSRTIKVSIWDDTNARVATTSASYSGAGVQTVTFASSVSVTSGHLYKHWFATTYETSGTIYIRYNTPDSNGVNIFQPGTGAGAGAFTYSTAFMAGPHFLFIQPCYAAGDAVPNTGNAGGGESFPVEPVFTIP